MSVTTSYATALSGSSIVLNGTLDDLHGEASLDVSFEWGATTAYGNETTPVSMSSLALFSASLDTSTLDEFHDTGNTYHFRAKATDGVTTWYGNDRYFVNLVTLGSDPYVIDNAMSTGTLTDTKVLEDVLLLDYYHGIIEEPEFLGLEITGGSITPLHLENPEFLGLAITGGTIT